jgi:hypothetical protein
MAAAVPRAMGGTWDLPAPQSPIRQSGWLCLDARKAVCLPQRTMGEPCHDDQRLLGPGQETGRLANRQRHRRRFHNFLEREADPPARSPTNPIDGLTGDADRWSARRPSLRRLKVWRWRPGREDRCHAGLFEIMPVKLGSAGRRSAVSITDNVVTQRDGPKPSGSARPDNKLVANYLSLATNR